MECWPGEGGAARLPALRWICRFTLEIMEIRKYWGRYFRIGAAVRSRPACLAAEPLPILLLLASRELGRNQMQDQFSNRDFVKSGGMFFLQIPRFRLFKFHSNWESSGYWEHDTADNCGWAAREMEWYTPCDTYWSNLTRAPPTLQSKNQAGISYYQQLLMMSGQVWEQRSYCSTVFHFVKKDFRVPRWNIPQTSNLHNHGIFHGGIFHVCAYCTSTTVDGICGIFNCGIFHSCTFCRTMGYIIPY